VPDRVLIKELPQMLRGRAPGEVSAALHRGLLAAGLPAERVDDEADEETAARRLLRWSQPGDVVVLPIHQSTVRLRLADLLDA
jgi:cyanophycin synthetase